jgi:hypothetical protein
MSISYQSKDDKVLSIALKVQELCVVSGDSILSVSGGNSVIDVGEQVAEVRAVMHVVPGDPVEAKASTKSGSQITVAGVVLAAGESLVVKYVIAE